MANFTYNWLDGTVTTVALPNETGFHCDYTNPSSNMNSACNNIVAHAHDSGDLNDRENYCASAEIQISAITNASSQILNQWDTLEIQCADWDNMFRSCSCCNDWCYMNENALENAYWNWKPLHDSNLSALQSIQTIWQDTSDQIALDGGQATDQALLDQLIAETNNQISLTQYNNEDRELRVASKKTSQIFMPIILILLIAGFGFYFYKK